jgi:hypothetical protein
MKTFDEMEAAYGGEEYVEDINQEPYETHEAAAEDYPEPSFTPEELATMGTPAQTGIISNYPTQTSEAKLLIPYIEKMNGALCIKCMDGESEEEIKKGYGIAVGYYNKALLSIKILFESQEGLITDQKQAI